MSASLRISSRVRTPRIMSIFTRGILQMGIIFGQWKECYCLESWWLIDNLILCWQWAASGFGALSSGVIAGNGTWGVELVFESGVGNGTEVLIELLVLWEYETRDIYRWRRCCLHCIKFPPCLSMLYVAIKRYWKLNPRHHIVYLYSFQPNYSKQNSFKHISSSFWLSS